MGLINLVGEGETTQLLKGVEIIGRRFCIAGGNIEADKVTRGWQNFQHGFESGQKLGIAIDPRILEKIESRF